MHVLIVQINYFLLINDIKDKTLTAATEQAYKGLIPIGKFGFVVLDIEMNPAKVDVNVHPAKLEVRFEEENKVFQAIYHAIKDTLLKTELVANSEKALHEEKMETARELTFEERLRNLKEEKQRKQEIGGLFSFRKQNGKQIENYTDEESKIKTNVLDDIHDKSNQTNENIIEDIYQAKNGIEKKVNLGEPIDTSDILAKLKQMKENLENELKEKSTESPILHVEENNKIHTEENAYIGENLEEEKEKYELKEENNQEDIVISENIKDENEENKENLNENTIIDAENDQENQDDQGIETKDSDKISEENQEATISEQTVDTTNEIIENIENPEIKQEFKEIKEKMQQLNDNPKVVSDDFNEMYAKLFGRLPIQDDDEKVEEKKEEKVIDILKDNVSVFEGIEEYQKPAYKFVGIVFKTYIIIEIGQEMYILDQHAAHERIMYEKVKENYYSESSKDSQMLLLPDVITLTHKEMDIAKENMEMFKKAGFTLEEFGENTIKLTGVPTVCIDLDTKELFLETLDEINTVARTAKQEKEEKFIATVACKAAVKANMALDQKEVESLMDKLLSLPNPFTCPHGRPTAIKMTKYDIERKFARK